MNLPSSLQHQLEIILGAPLEEISFIHGGSIHQTSKITNNKGSFFIKISDEVNGLAMLEAEKEGLQAIAETEAISTPNVIVCEQNGKISFLLMEYIPHDPSPTKEKWYTLGENLAELHRNKNEKFGFNQPNFIGKLPQSNEPHSSWASFYIQERIMPQISRACRNNLLMNKYQKQNDEIKAFFTDLLPDCTPSLLHGDLWNGNVVFKKDGKGYVIDPAVYYGHREMDLAMSELFGGFDPSFYDAYQQNYPLSDNYKMRKSYYQLYYLLVHLNLFGKTYHTQVASILHTIIKPK